MLGVAGAGLDDFDQVRDRVAVSLHGADQAFEVHVVRLLNAALHLIEGAEAAVGRVAHRSQMVTFQAPCVGDSVELVVLDAPEKMQALAVGCGLGGEAEHPGVRAADGGERRTGVDRRDLALAVHANHHGLLALFSEDTVGDLGHPTAEAPRLREAETLAVNCSHGILRAPELVDLLMRVTDVGLRATLRRDDRGSHWVGILRLVKQDVVVGQERPAQLEQRINPPSQDQSIRPHENCTLN